MPVSEIAENVPRHKYFSEKQKMKVKDLLNANMLCCEPHPEVLERYSLPFVFKGDPLDRDDLQLILLCDDFDSIETDDNGNFRIHYTE